jgi:hypothetical protein
MRQSKIDQDGFAAWQEHDAARLDVVMNDVLPMQVGQRERDFSGDGACLFVSQRQLAKPAVQRFARDTLHHHIGLPREIAGAETAGHVRSRQPRQDHLLHLETDNRSRILAFGHPGDFHQ